MADQHKIDDKQNGNECKLVNPTTPEPRALTNIYYDCLERIFDFLDLDSLLNVAGTCKRLQIAAAAKFRDDHGHKTVFFTKHGPFERNVPEQGIKSLVYHLDIYGFKIWLAVLRCFGAKISRCSVRFYKGADKRNDLLDQYLNQYCADTLTAIYFHNKREFRNENFPKQFKNIVKVAVGNSCLGNQLPNFLNWFPSLRKLEMINVSINGTVVAVSFPHLEHLSVKFRDNVLDHLTNEKATKFLNANRQLRNLTILPRPGTSLGEILHMINKNPYISQLNIHRIANGDAGKDEVELNRLAADHPSMEALTLCDFLITTDVAITLISKLKSLEVFAFNIEDRFEVDRFLNHLDIKWKYSVVAFNDSFRIFLTLRK